MFKFNFDGAKVMVSFETTKLFLENFCSHTLNDPASEDNGMRRYMEANDEEAWD